MRSAAARRKAWPSRRQGARSPAGTPAAGSPLRGRAPARANANALDHLLLNPPLSCGGVKNGKNTSVCEKELEDRGCVHPRQGGVALREQNPLPVIHDRLVAAGQHTHGLRQRRHAFCECVHPRHFPIEPPCSKALKQGGESSGLSMTLSRRAVPRARQERRSAST